MIQVAVVSAMKGFELIEDKINERLAELQKTGNVIRWVGIETGNTHFMGLIMYDDVQAQQKD